MAWLFASISRARLRSELQCAAFETNVLANPLTLPFATARQIECYGALQESATYAAYRQQKDRTRVAGDEVLGAIFLYVARMRRCTAAVTSAPGIGAGAGPRVNDC